MRRKMDCILTAASESCADRSTFPCRECGSSSELGEGTLRQAFTDWGASRCVDFTVGRSGACFGVVGVLSSEHVLCTFGEASNV